jgi:hypothetical protein
MMNREDAAIAAAIAPVEAANAAAAALVDTVVSSLSLYNSRNWISTADSENDVVENTLIRDNSKSPFPN